MTCNRITGSILLSTGILGILVSTVVVAQASLPQPAPAAIVELMRVIGNLAVITGLLSLGLAAIGGLVLVRSRLAFAGCVLAIVAILGGYAVSLALWLESSWSDALLMLPILVLLAAAARCSRPQPRLRVRHGAISSA